MELNTSSQTDAPPEPEPSADGDGTEGEKKKTRRISLNLSDVDSAALDRIVKHRSSSNANYALRDAIKLYEYILRQTNDTGEFTLVNNDGDICKVLIL